MHVRFHGYQARNLCGIRRPSFLLAVNRPRSQRRGESIPDRWPQRVDSLLAIVPPPILSLSPSLSISHDAPRLPARYEKVSNWFRLSCFRKSGWLHFPRAFASPPPLLSSSPFFSFSTVDAAKREVSSSVCRPLNLHVASSSSSSSQIHDAVIVAQFVGDFGGGGRCSGSQSSSVTWFMVGVGSFFRSLYHAPGCTTGWEGRKQFSVRNLLSSRLLRKFKLAENIEVAIFQWMKRWVTRAVHPVSSSPVDVGNNKGA